MANSIAAQIGEDRPKEVIATTVAAYALSSILTGGFFSHCLFSSAMSDLGTYRRLVVLLARGVETWDVDWVLPEAYPRWVRPFFLTLSERTSAYLRATPRCIGGVGVFLIQTG